MPAYSFICTSSGGSWSAVGYGDNAEITASADSEYELSKELRKVRGEAYSARMVGCFLPTTRTIPSPRPAHPATSF